METLSEMFQLEIPTVHSIISKMIINEELMVRCSCTPLWVKHIHFFDNWVWIFLFVSDRHRSTNLHRLWSCTGQSPHPCRTWRCSSLRSWAAWWRITSAFLTSNKACMEVTSTEVRCSPSPYCWLNSFNSCPYMLNSVLDTILRLFICFTDQKGGYQQKQSYQRGMLKHIQGKWTHADHSYL